MTTVQVKSHQKQQQKPQIEYSVYIYHHPYNHLEGWNDWEKRIVTSDLNKALDEAESLFATDEFEKVEVKQKMYDSKRNQSFDTTLKIYDRKGDERLQKLFKKLISRLSFSEKN